MASRTRLSPPDDILIEIFAYLPLNSIYKFKCISKVWLSNLSHHSFITKWFQINNKSLPWIHYHSKSNHIRLTFGISYRYLHSEFMSTTEHLFSFKFLMNEKQFQGAILFLLGSSNGLVLCYSLHLDNQRRYHVCNPLTQKWASIPSPPCTEVSPYDVQGISCQYSSSFTSCYKVVRIPAFYSPSKKFKVDIFCSDLGLWETFEVLCNESVAWDYNLRNVVIHNSVVFYIEEGGRMLVYNLDQKDGNGVHRCSLINLPDEQLNFHNFDRRIGVSEGRVLYARTGIMGGKMTVSVWVLDEINWQVLHMEIAIDNTLAELRSRIDDQAATIQLLGFCPVERNVVLFGCKQWVWGFNIQTRTVEELCFGNRHLYHPGRMLKPFVLKPMPTVLPSPS